MPDKYYELLKTNQPMFLFSPYDVEREYGKPFSYIDITKEYDSLVHNDKIKKYKINARELEGEISKLQQESGYPYIVNIDTANRDNPIHGMITMSNLCVHGETKILTKNGYEEIQKLAGQKVDVWNGEEWSEVDVVQTNTNQKLLQIKTDSGHEIKTTPYHKFYTDEGVEVRAGELKVGQKLITPERLPNLDNDDTPSPYNGENPVVISIEEVDGLHDTFCFTEPKRHMGMFNGLLTGNCSEILQVQKPSKLNPDLSYDEVGMDISCNLGSLNAVNLLEAEDFELTVNTSVRALSRVSEITNIEQVPTVKQANDSYHSIGLGMMNLATAFAINKMHYGSPESIELTDALFRTVRFYGLKASNEIARETGIKFFEFEKSKYADGSYLFKKYIDVDEFEFKYESAKNAFKNVKVPTIEDWKQLNEDIMKYGLYNSVIMAVAPNGSIGYVSDASASIHPIINRIENRQEGKIGSVYYPTPYLSNETLPYLKSAYDIDMRKVVDVYAAAQQHVDQGLSLTLFFRSDYTGFECPYEWKDKNQPKLTTRDLNKIRNYAWTKGIKSIYYIRQFTGGNDRQSINECESCVI